MDHCWAPTPTNRWKIHFCYIYSHGDSSNVKQQLPPHQWRQERTLARANIIISHSTPSTSFCKFCMCCFFSMSLPLSLTQTFHPFACLWAFLQYRKLRCLDSQYPEHKKYNEIQRISGKKSLPLIYLFIFQDFHRFPWFSPLSSHIFFERPLLRCLRHRCSVRRHSASGPAAAALGSGQLLSGKRAKPTACNEIGGERGLSYGYLDIKHT